VAGLQAECPAVDRRDREDGRRYMLTVHRRDGRLVAMVKGSPEEVLALCDRAVGAAGPMPLDEARRLGEARPNADMATPAERELPERYTEADLQAGFEWYGLVGLAAPIRPAVPATIQALHSAGIRTVMITGDQALTAVAVARELQLSRRGVVNTLEANDLTSIDAATLRGPLRGGGIFPRGPPEMKPPVRRAYPAHGKILPLTPH